MSSSAQPPLPSLLRIGTRGSQLALWQAHYVAGELERLGVASQVVTISTQGDRDQSSSFGQMGSKGIFVKELEKALLEAEVDVAVHSLKDLPTVLPEGLELAAVPPRASAHDAWVSADGRGLQELREGETVATGSLRRAAQLRALRPGLNVIGLRGNVPTRLERIKQGAAAGTIMAQAGLVRLGLEAAITQPLPLETFIPSMGQGALGIQTRQGEWSELWKQLEDALSRQAVEIERGFLRAIGGGCHTPVGVHAQPGENGGWHVRAMLSDVQGQDVQREDFLATDFGQAVTQALALARQMRSQASAAVLATLHEPFCPKDTSPR